MLLEAQLIFAGNVLFGLSLNENTLYAENSYSIKLDWYLIGQMFINNVYYKFCLFIYILIFYLLLLIIIFKIR